MTDDEVPNVAGIRDDVLTDLVAFVRALRRGGVAVPANAAIVAARAQGLNTHLATAGFVVTTVIYLAIVFPLFSIATTLW